MERFNITPHYIPLYREIDGGKKGQYLSSAMKKEKKSEIRRKPPWLKVPPPWGGTFTEVRKLLRGSSLHTVCEAAKCPNIGECFSRGTATFLLMGQVCTRHCAFCNIHAGATSDLDKNEPINVAKTIEELKLRFAVITSVTRDDLPDGGASHFAKTIEAIRQGTPDVGIEVLIPDFKGDEKALQTVLAAKPDVLNHNIETVKSLYPMVRPEADYQRSLELLRKASQMGHDGLIVKSGLMVGLGEQLEEIVELLQDLAEHGVASVTIGQYLPPSGDHATLVRYVTPEEFEKLGQIAQNLGIKHVYSSPLVRSSYHADDITK